MIAMQSPAGTYHHHRRGKAPFCCAQNRMVPQFRLLTGITPMKARVVRPRMAAVTVPTKLEAMSAMRFGSISTVMMRRSGSPFARAAWMKSRLRSDMV